MQIFTIRDIEHLTGIKAHTLRIWEQRYNFFKSKRKDSNHRFYDNDDLKKLICISFLYHNGLKVSKIAGLSQEEIKEKVLALETTTDYTGYTQRLLEAAVDFNTLEFKKILNNLTVTIGFEKTIEHVCYPFLYKIGLLWDTNHIIPAQEHFSSSIIQEYIIYHTGLLKSTPGEPEILLFCPEGEYHELPLLYMNYLLKKNNWKVLYLGANIKPQELEEALSLYSVKFLYLHLITNLTGSTVEEYLKYLHHLFPDKKIIASGTGIYDAEIDVKEIKILKQQKEKQDFIERHHALETT